MTCSPPVSLNDQPALHRADAQIRRPPRAAAAIRASPRRSCSPRNRDRAAARSSPAPPPRAPPPSAPRRARPSAGPARRSPAPAPRRSAGDQKTIVSRWLVIPIPAIRPAPPACLDHLPGAGEARLPDLLRVMLDPAVPRIMLRQLPLRDPQARPVRPEQHRPSARRARIDDEDDVPAIPAPYVIPTEVRTLNTDLREPVPSVFMDANQVRHDVRGRMDSFDLLIIGGGINGAAIARDAAGRGLDVLLVEKDDLAAPHQLGLVQADPRRPSLSRAIRVPPGPRIAARARDPARQRAAPRPAAQVRPARSARRPPLLAAAARPAALRSARRPAQRAAALAPREGRRSARSSPASASPPIGTPGSTMPAWSSLNALDAHERGAEIATRTELLSARRDGEPLARRALRRPHRLGAA